MFVLQLLRFFFGYVKFQVVGGFKERFFNLVRQTDARVWELRKSNSVMEGYVIAGDYKKLRSAAKKAGCRLHVKKRCGLPFIIRPYRKRWGLLVGAVSFCLLIAWLSTGVWSIKISGNQTVSRREIMDVLEQNGLTYGSRLDKINEIELSGKVLLTMPELSYMSVYLNGCIAEVTVRESEEGMGIIDRESPCNLLSDKKGKILSLQVYDGDEAVEVGDYVDEGQLLISGVIERQLDNKITHARGKVIAQTEYQFEITQPFDATLPMLSGEDHTRHSLRFFSAEIPLYIGRIQNDFSLYERDNSVNVNGVELPIGIKTEIFEGRQTEAVSLTAEQAERLCEIRLKFKELSLFSHDDIIEKNVEKVQDDQGITLKASYKVKEEIGVESPIQVEDSEDELPSEQATENG